MKLTKAQELQASLKAGDIIIATEIDHFSYNEEIKKKHLYSQQPGDLILVNNTHVVRTKDGEILQLGDSVSGCSLNGVAYNGRACLGLGGSLTVGKFRLATPDDPGYMATREVFELHDNQTIAKLKQKLQFVYTVGAVSAIMGLWLLGAIL